MKIRLLLNVGRNDAKHFPLLKEGEHEVERDVGLRLIERGWAVCIDDPPKKLRAVPPPQAIQTEASAEKATDELKSYRARQARVTETKQPANKEQ